MDVQIECPCPGSPHEQDTVTLRDKLDFFGASSIRNAVLVLKETDPKSSTADVLAVMTEANLLAGISAWTIRGPVENDKGKLVDGPVPVTRPAIREYILSNLGTAMQIGEAADSLYRDVMLPLLMRAFKSSPASPTKPPTSQTNGSERKPRKPSKPSSISTIPTAGTETTSRSLDGVSNSSQSSESAA